MRLVDVARGIMSPANLSRIERHEKYKLPHSTVLALGIRLGLVLKDAVNLQAWTREVGQAAIELLRKWRFSDALRVLQSRDTVLTPTDPAAEIQAQILAEWARTHCDQTSRPEAIRALSRQARDRGALRQAVWAQAFEAKLRGDAGDRDLAFKLLKGASTEAEAAGEVADALSIRAVWGRLLLKEGQAVHGLEILREVRDLTGSASDYAQARYLQAQGLLCAAAGCPEDAEQALCAAVRAALRIPNHRMAGALECALADVYETLGGTDKADAALVRAASAFTQAGDSHDARDAISLALRHHISGAGIEHETLLSGYPDRGVPQDPDFVRPDLDQVSFLARKLIGGHDPGSRQ